jgi:hypothetical protein
MAYEVMFATRFPTLTGWWRRGRICGRLHIGRGRLESPTCHLHYNSGDEAAGALVLLQRLRDLCDRVHDRRLGEHSLRRHL